METLHQENDVNPLDQGQSNSIYEAENLMVHHRFEEQAARTPEMIAIVDQGRQLTYQQLNAKANQLAHYLQKQGVGSEVLVGIVKFH